MTELERLLERTARELDWPPVPDVTAGVSERLRSKRPARRRLSRLPVARPVLVAVVALLLLAATVVAAVPPARDAVLDLFGLRGATIERRERLPHAPPRRAQLALGERVSLEQAAGFLAFEPLAPAAVPAPDAVYVRPNATPGGELSLAYTARTGLPEAATTGLGLLVTEFRGDLDPLYIGKIAPQATRVERVHLDGMRAVWIEGAPHLFFYRDPNGDFRETRHRLAENVLLFERGRVLVRLEGRFGPERARELARSLSPAGA